MFVKNTFGDSIQQSLTKKEGKGIILLPQSVLHFSVLQEIIYAVHDVVGLLEGSNNEPNPREWTPQDL